MGRFDDEWELLVAARIWLAEAGYQLIESRGPEGMQSGLDLYLGAVAGIRLVADRSQWFVDVRPAANSNDWSSLEAWSICLGAPVVFHDTRPRLSERDWLDVITNSWWLRPQLDYLRSHLRSIENACQPTRVKDTLDRLAIARAATAAFPPSDSA